MGKRALVVFAVLWGVVLSTGLYAATAADKSGTIVLDADDIAAAGFTDNENLISFTNTLHKAYSNTLNLNIASNNNWCESTNDSVMHYKDGISNGELSGLWVTWDTNYLYVAIQGQAKGRGNNIMCFLDTNVERGVVDQSTMTWNRRIIFADGFRPNAYVGMWCANEVAHFNGTSAGGDAQLFYYTTGWMMLNNGLTPSSPFYAWYNGSSQTDPARRLFMFRVHWGILTNTEAVPTGASLSLRIAAVTTGPDSGALVYDTLPENEFCTNTGVMTYVNNYFSIPITDASGNILLGVNPRDTAAVNFYPGSRTALISKPKLVSPADGAANVDLNTLFEITPASHTNGLALTYQLYLSTNSNFVGTTPILIASTRMIEVMAAGIGGLILMIGACLPFRRGKRRVLAIMVFVALFIGVVLFTACGDDPVPPAGDVLTYSTGAPLETSTTYYWKVSATDVNGYIITSDVRHFTTK